MRRLPYVLVGGGWFAASLIAGIFLVHSAYASARHGDFLDRAAHLVALLSPDLPERPALQQQLESAVRGDEQVRYAMIWRPDGTVMAHTRVQVLDQFLDPARWPALDADEAYRISIVEVPEWLTGDRRVMEFTVPFKNDGKAAAFLSLGVPRDRLADTGSLLMVLGFSLVSTGIVVAGMLFGERRFERARREIVQESRARTSLLTERGMLASVLAHEIRSPLTALRFNLHSLRQLLGAVASETADKQMELTDRCEREIRRLDNMLTDFLHHTQVITGSGAEPTALNGVVQEAMEFLRPTLERSGIHVSLHLDPADPRVPVHPDELRQVILNLTANAQEAMQDLPAAVGRTLAISTISDENPEAPTATLLIRDSGRGIAPEVRQRIFEPFFSTKPNGSGLGLTLVRRVISGAGGTVLYESSPEENVGGAGEGAGTTFRITLPRVNGAAAGG